MHHPVHLLAGVRLGVLWIKAVRVGPRREGQGAAPHGRLRGSRYRRRQRHHAQHRPDEPESADPSHGVLLSLHGVRRILADRGEAEEGHSRCPPLRLPADAPQDSAHDSRHPAGRRSRFARGSRPKFPLDTRLPVPYQGIAAAVTPAPSRRSCPKPGPSRSSFSSPRTRLSTRRLQAGIVLAEAAHRVAVVPSAVPAFAEVLEFILRVRRRDRHGAAACEDPAQASTEADVDQCSRGETGQRGLREQTGGGGEDRSGSPGCGTDATT